MGFWIFMLFCDLLIPAVMIGFGKEMAEETAEGDQQYIWVSNNHVNEE